jgi:hypothetical protein
MTFIYRPEEMNEYQQRWLIRAVHNELIYKLPPPEAIPRNPWENFLFLVAGYSEDSRKHTGAPFKSQTERGFFILLKIDSSALLTLNA